MPLGSQPHAETVRQPWPQKDTAAEFPRVLGAGLGRTDKVKYSCRRVTGAGSHLSGSPASLRQRSPDTTHLSPRATAAKLTCPGPFRPGPLSWEGLDWPHWVQDLHSDPASYGPKSSLSAGCLTSWLHREELPEKGH